MAPPLQEKDPTCEEQQEKQYTRASEGERLLSTPGTSNSTQTNRYQDSCSHQFTIQQVLQQKLCFLQQAGSYSHPPTRVNPEILAGLPFCYSSHKSNARTRSANTERRSSTANVQQTIHAQYTRTHAVSMEPNTTLLCHHCSRPKLVSLSISCLCRASSSSAWSK